MPRRGAASVPGRRARVRRASVPALVVFAVLIAAITMVGLSARAVIARASCSRHPVLVNLAVNSDIYPTIQTIARTFNTQSQVVNGRCVVVEVSSGQSATVASEVDGQTPMQGLATIDAWIPDSSVWIDVARSYPLGAQVVPALGISIARSPIMLVTSRAVADQTGIFGPPASWNLLVPSSYGGPPGGLGLTVDIPEPADSAVGLISLIEVSRALGQSPAGRAGFAKFEYSTTPTSEFDSAGQLANFVESTVKGFNRRVLTEASEQAVISYDRQNPQAPLAARYPTSGSKALAAAELDYPYVITSSQADVSQAAAAFGRFLAGSYAQSLIRYAGFRSAADVLDTVPPSFGLSSQPFAVATPPGTSETSLTISAWKKIGLGSRLLVLFDVSGAMNTPVSPGGPSIEFVTTRTASSGLGLFPDNTEMGLWEMPDLSSGQPYKILVGTGLLTGDVGLMSRRQQLQEINATLRSGTKPLFLYKAMVAGYQSMTNSYDPRYVNTLLLLTAGVDDPQDMPFSAALAQIKHLYNPSKKVNVVVLDFGGAQFRQLSQITAATGGQAFLVSSPSQVGKIFAEAFANRLCNQGCSVP